ncbi:MAG: SHOCT domain-containing protein [Bacteroidales bacterium]|nr:SHOCT domain-containing protein [Bacteroidales bacterium]
MKKIVALFFLFFLWSNVNCQNIKEDYYDNFTKKHIIETKRVQFFDLNTNVTMECSFKAVGSDLAMILKAIVGGFAPQHFSVDVGKTVAVLMSDGSVVWFLNPQFAMTSKGGGTSGFAGSAAPGITLYLISEEITKLADDNLQIDKIRLYTNHGYKDIEVESKKAKAIKQDLQLIISKMDKPTANKEEENANSLNNKINPSQGMTSEEAIRELEKWKKKLDLQIITQEEYDKKKEELMKFIE